VATRLLKHDERIENDVILRDRMDVAATVEQVWEVLADPALMELWNPKCVSCTVSGGPARVGLRYQASFRLSGPEQKTNCEIIDCRPCEVLVTRMAVNHPTSPGYVDETFRLSPRGAGARIEHEVDFAHSGLPRWLMAFMKVLDVVGRKAGKSSLDGIRELLEPGPT